VIASLVLLVVLPRTEIPSGRVLVAKGTAATLYRKLPKLYKNFSVGIQRSKVVRGRKGCYLAICPALKSVDFCQIV
jgi:hypothetical protein